jgi:hypothetical protein
MPWKVHSTLRMRTGTNHNRSSATYDAAALAHRCHVPTAVAQLGHRPPQAVSDDSQCSRKATANVGPSYSAIASLMFPLRRPAVVLNVYSAVKRRE